MILLVSIPWLSIYFSEKYRIQSIDNPPWYRYFPIDIGVSILWLSVLITKVSIVGSLNINPVKFWIFQRTEITIDTPAKSLVFSLTNQFNSFRLFSAENSLICITVFSKSYNLKVFPDILQLYRNFFLLKNQLLCCLWLEIPAI